MSERQDNSKSSTISRTGLVKQISAVSNPVVKEIRGLTLKKNRDATGQFITEGFKLVADAVEAGWTLRTLIYCYSVEYSPELKSKLETIAAKVVATGGLVLEVSEKVLKTLAKRDNPQMVIGVFDQQYMDLNKLTLKDDMLLVALDRVRDPGNLGTIIRTCDAFGASGVILVGECTDPFALEAVRATMGSIFHVPIVRMTMGEFLNWNDEFKGKLIGTHLEGSVDHRTVEYKGAPMCLLMGNEQQGLPAELSFACDQLVRIAMCGQADSLNLAIATGIMIQAMRQGNIELLTD